MKNRYHVKAQNTTTTVASSQAEIRKLLARYGAHGLSLSEDMQKGEIIVRFAVPDKPGSKITVPVSIPVSVLDVARALYGPGILRRNEARWLQAERVAWRNLVLWIDAALSAASIGLQTITEAFFAHAVVGPGGERMITVVEHAQQALGPGVQRLLTSGAEPE